MYMDRCAMPTLHCGSLLGTADTDLTSTQRCDGVRNRLQNGSVSDSNSGNLGHRCEQIAP